MSEIVISKTKVADRISVADFLKNYGKQLELELVAGHKGLNRYIRESSMNRPALALTGFFKFLAVQRIQLFGAGEMAYLRELEGAEQSRVIEAIAKRHVPCFVVSRNLAPSKAFKEIANRHSIPLLRTPLKSKIFTTEATVRLAEYFAPRTSLHGTLLDIRGVGTLLCGESGVGKSECALALIERGHSLVADDITYVKRLTEDVLVGTSSDLNRGYMECRGIGIINIADLFGVRAVRLDKRIDLAINFTSWQPGMHEERTGLEQNFMDVLGINIPLMVIPVRPGRDMARLVEVAAMVQALKGMGHDSAREFNERLIKHMSSQR